MIKKRWRNTDLDNNGSWLKQQKFSETVRVVYILS